ncbi:GGDEF domain-containing protein [Algibacillus agarilyticus]|uniref:GGDEF domain-containing protein n=1 Tax=Algibacillus agarilyticus TaxID=2234133 RepID=UPI000DD07C65|nr:GGDEF domain-containing protein [Algibacillus agarilyticus]
MENSNHFNLNCTDNVMHLPTSSVAALRTEFEPNFNHLVERLHTSLLVNDILQMYAEEAAKYVAISGIHFQTTDETYQTPDYKMGVVSHLSEITLFDDRLGLMTYACNEPLDEENQQILNLIQTKLAYPIRNALAVAELKKQALNDHLTGLGNRGFFDEKFDKSVYKARASNTDYTLILLDLDNFKKANDNWGHAQGDQVLMHFARILEQSIRKTDLAFRFGGDEFAIILEGANELAATRVAKLIKKATNTSELMNKMGVSVSIGYSQLLENTEPKALFNKADKALYLAKRAGRNCARSA